jgi:glycosyltransferase involved in cell wall biosynthesis
VRVLWFTTVIPQAVARHLGMDGGEGQGSWIESLEHEITERGQLELAVATPCREKYAPFTSNGVTYHGLPVVEARTRIARAVSEWRGSFVLPDMNAACAEVVRDFEPDLIHVHGTENPFGLLTPHTRVPVVISLQGLLSVYEKFYFSGMTSRDRASLTLQKSFLLGRGALQGYWQCSAMAAREREIIRTNTSFMGRTEWDREVLWAINPKAAYHHCGEVLRSLFYESAWRREAAQPETIFCTSNTIAWKGADCLIEALSILRSAGHPEVHLRIAGIPPEGPGNRYFPARARKYGVMDRIAWLGRLDATGLVNELLSASVFAYPTHIDNSPNALCEALLVGAPTVTTYAGGVPSLLDDEREGLLCQNGDPYALAAKLHRMLDDGDFAATVGARARERALHRHDPGTIVGDLLGVYSSVASTGE